MTMMLETLARSATATLIALASGSLAFAQTPAEFYKGKTVELVIGYGVGGGYDLYARIIARHLGKHMPGNPAVVPKNMAGAAGMRLANWLASAAPKDGTTLGAVSRAMAFEPLLGNKAAQYDGTKFNWIGSANDEVSVCVAWHTSGVTKIEDVLASELAVGAAGVADDTYQFPAVLNGLHSPRRRA
jgi:tripartite-type tricarboxylate transporter receptor subunit TctC